ncbi:carboxypeptidase B-like [Daphnia pulicaria]|uniref:carboxypeptidase B-like n=1 Tax=Daphnia pulicaria TaxID=35523 RepID=UPI001EEA075E|nr:carboxypeptidase B-like [Daphnia pulicaria]
MSLGILFGFFVTLTGFVVTFPASPTENNVVSYSKFQVWRITPSTNEENQILMEICETYGLTILNEAKLDNTSMDLLIPPELKIKLENKLDVANIPYAVTIGDLQKAINNQNSNATIRNSKTAPYNMTWTSYHRLSDIYGYMNYLAVTYPSLVSLINIGTSYEKRPLYVLRISNSSSPGKNSAIWIDAGIHAREWIAPAVASYFIQQLVEVPANAKLLTNVDWYIMPVVNPDGYEYTFVTDRLWRKTRSLTSSSSCRGVDPNRNFGYKWGGLGTSTNPCSDIYKGTKAFSEPETNATSNFILGKANQIKLYLTLHSYGQYALIPWGYDVAYPPDYNDMLALANKAVSKFVKYKFSVGNSAALLYAAAGGSDDWAKSIGIKYSYTFELADTDTYGFILPASEILPVSHDFFPALDVFAKQVATCCGVATTTTSKPTSTIRTTPKPNSVKSTTAKPTSAKPTTSKLSSTKPTTKKLLTSTKKLLTSTKKPTITSKKLIG